MHSFWPETTVLAGTAFKKMELVFGDRNQGIKTVVCGRKTAFLKSRPDKLSYTAVSRHTPATVTNTMSLHNKSAK